MGVAHFMLEGVEADDVIATLAVRAVEAGMRVDIASPDKVRTSGKHSMPLSERLHGLQPSSACHVPPLGTHVRSVTRRGAGIRDTCVCPAKSGAAHVMRSGADDCAPPPTGLLPAAEAGAAAAAADQEGRPGDGARAARRHGGVHGGAVRCPKRPNSVPATAMHSISCELIAQGWQTSMVRQAYSTSCQRIARGCSSWILGFVNLAARGNVLRWEQCSREGASGLRRFREDFDGLDPEYFADMLALMGDASDNVPGVKGLGPKTALPLLLQFGTVEALLDRVDEVCNSLQLTMLSRELQVAICSMRHEA